MVKLSSPALLRKPPFTNLPLQIQVLQFPPFTNPYFTNPPFSNPVQSTPVQSSPLHSTPLHSTPLHSTPLHSTPLHSTPLHSTPLHSPFTICQLLDLRYVSNTRSRPLKAAVVFRKENRTPSGPCATVQISVQVEVIPHKSQNLVRQNHRSLS